MTSSKRKPKKPRASRRARKILTAVVHLPSLPGSPGAFGIDPSEALERAGEWAVKEGRVLERAGFDRLIVENLGDAPFFSTQVPPETIAALSVIAGALRSIVKIPVGVNVLRNDGFAALAIAAVNRCEFIRINVLGGVVATDQGLIEGQAAKLLRERARLQAPVEIWADVHVKHAQTLHSLSVAQAIHDTAHRGGADAVIVSGSGTGRAVDLNLLKEASGAAKDSQTLLFLGSGVTSKNVQDLVKQCSGAIVSSDLRQGGRAGAPLDPARIKAFIKAAHA